MGQLDGKVAFVTGAARGQGRSHAIRLAQEGADIIALDACATPDWLSYPLATEADLLQAVKEPRDTWEIDLEQFRELVDVTLTGTFITVKAAIPPMIAAGQGGSIVLTSSGAAITAGGGLADYKAAKNGVLALKDTLACELAKHFIRVNAICPTAVDTPMIQNEHLYRAFRPDLAAPGRDDVKAGFAEMNLLPIPWVDPVDVSNAIVWLASDAARYVTGVTLPIDAGNHLKC